MVPEHPLGLWPFSDRVRKSSMPLSVLSTPHEGVGASCLVCQACPRVSLASEQDPPAFSRLAAVDEVVAVAFAPPQVLVASAPPRVDKVVAMAASVMEQQ